MAGHASQGLSALRANLIGRLIDMTAGEAGAERPRSGLRKPAFPASSAEIPAHDLTLLFLLQSLLHQIDQLLMGMDP